MQKSMASPERQAIRTNLLNDEVSDCVIREHDKFLSKHFPQKELYTSQNFANGALLCALLAQKFPSPMTESTLKKIQWDYEHVKPYNLNLARSYLHQMQHQQAANSDVPSQLSIWDKKLSKIDTNDIAEYYRELYECDVKKSNRYLSRCNIQHTIPMQSDKNQSQRARTQGRVSYSTKKRTQSTSILQANSIPQDLLQSPSKLRRPSIISPVKRLTSLEKKTSKNTSNVTESKNCTGSKETLKFMERKSKNDASAASKKLFGSRIPRFTSESRCYTENSPSRHSFVALREVKKQIREKSVGNTRSDIIGTRHRNTICCLEEEEEDDDDDDTISISTASEENACFSNVGQKRPRDSVPEMSKTQTQVEESEMEIDEYAYDSFARQDTCVSVRDEMSLSMESIDQSKDECGARTSESFEEKMEIRNSDSCTFINEHTDENEIVEALYMDLRKDNARLHLKMEHVNIEINHMYLLLTRIERRMQDWQSKHDSERPNSAISAHYTQIIQKLEQILQTPKQS